uniref:L1 transposable element RRM domain-containing protein n=1 Tax=Labrus bergylta TaxID=56723 RepID=A0A3Q3E900_9LABR
MANNERSSRRGTKPSQTFNKLASKSPSKDGDGHSLEDKVNEQAEEEPCPPWAEKIIQEITSVQEKINIHLPTIQATTARIESELASLTNCITTAEQRISDVEDKLSPISESHKTLESQVDQLSQKVDYLENYSRRNNLCIVNIAENMEGSDIKVFATNLLKTALDIPADQPGPELERAHRVGPPRDSNGKPRPIIIRLLRFQDKENILHASRRKGELSYKSRRFFIFQDYSVTVSQRRAEYNPIKTALHHALTWADVI